jgi:hypothetical protein
MALPGAYPNFLTEDDADRVAESYGRNAGRLIAAKRRYDPDNVFCSAIPLPTGPVMAEPLSRRSSDGWNEPR